MSGGRSERSQVGVNSGTKNEVSTTFRALVIRNHRLRAMQPWACARVTRREFLGSVLLASGSALLQGISPADLPAGNDDFTGYGGVGEYSTSNGNTLEGP